MTKAEIKKFLLENSITEQELNEMWDFCSAFPELGGALVKKLSDQGLSWKNLNPLAAKSIFDLHKSIETKLLNSMIEDD